MDHEMVICQVAVPVPMRQTYDYIVKGNVADVHIGARVDVPFGRRRLIGIITKCGKDSVLPRSRLKQARVLDSEPLINPEIIKLLFWASDYYHYPLGEVLQAAIPVALRQGKDPRSVLPKAYRLTKVGQALSLADLARSPAQQALMAEMLKRAQPITERDLSTISKTWRRTIKILEEKSWLEAIESDANQQPQASQVIAPAPGAPDLTPEQEKAVSDIVESSGRFDRFLLYGITGSGKTEVYLSAIKYALQQEKQVLVLVPEIALTPQLIRRFEARIDAPLAVMHSGMVASQRLSAWQRVRQGQARLILGTRSAVFAPIPNLGLIIVDEEHDGSFKQQDGFRYQGRDVAIKRAQLANIPIVLGSATPSLESWEHVRRGNYRLYKLSQRHGESTLPIIHFLDMRQVSTPEGLSPNAVEALSGQLEKGEQSLIFINRRGFAPALLCRDCGWVANCARCDANLVFHQKINRLRCHHCGHDQQTPERCPECNCGHLHPMGEGTERIADILVKRLPGARISRLDRDSTQRKGSLDKILDAIRKHETDIVVGTQMLVKGHHFPNVTLVVVVNADQGLYSVDYRASEQLFQQIAQVAGRAGRGEKAGHVMVQTYHPDHRLFSALQQHDYELFAREALNERCQTGFPPFTYLGLLRAESTSKAEALDFVSHARALGFQCPGVVNLNIGEAVTAPMERKAGRYRTQLLISSRERRHLHNFLNHWIGKLEQSKLSRRVRWSLDVDPQDLY